MPFGHEAVDKLGLKRAKLDVVTSDDEIVEVIDGEGLGGIVLTPIEVEVRIIENGGGDVCDNEEEIDGVEEDKELDIIEEELLAELVVAAEEVV